MASVLKADIIPFWFDLVCFDSPVCEYGSYLSCEIYVMIGSMYFSDEISKELEILFSSSKSFLVLSFLLFNMAARPFIIVLSVKDIFS